MKRLASGLAAALLFAFASTAIPADPEADAFVKSLIAATNAKDPPKRKALLHPDSLRCGDDRREVAGCPKPEGAAVRKQTGR